MYLKKNKTTLILLGILLLGFCIRIIAIRSQSFWYDEAFSILISEKGPGAILAGTLSMDEPSLSADIHPPAYYFTLFLWIKLFGRSVFAGRMLSLLFGMGIICNQFFIAKELRNIKFAVVSCLVLIFMPFQQKYAVDVRMYSMLAFWLTLATLAYLKASHNKARLWWAVFAVSAAVSQYTHNLAAFYLITLASTALFSRNLKILLNTLLAGVSAIVLYIPWLIHIPAQFSKVQQHYWIARPDFSSFFSLALRYVVNLPVPQKWLFLALFCSLTCIIMAVFQTLRVWRQKREGVKEGLWLFYLAFVPPILLWLFSQWIPIYVDRGFLAAHAMFCTWLAWVFTEIEMPKIVRGVLVGTTALGCLFGMSYYYSNEGSPIDPYIALDTWLEQHVQPEDIVIHSNKLSYLPIFYYSPELPMLYINDQEGSDTDTLSRSTREVLGLSSSDDLQTAVQSGKTIWFVIFQKSIDEFKEAGYTTHPHVTYLDSNFEMIDHQYWQGIHLYEYQLIK